MKTEKLTMMRFTAEDGKSLQWTQKVYSWAEHKIVEEPQFAERTAVIALEDLVGKVEEIPLMSYGEWHDKMYPLDPNPVPMKCCN